MKNIYSLLAAVITFFTMATPAYAVEDDPDAVLKVIWESVEVVPVGNTHHLVAKIKVQSEGNRPFSGDVFALLCTTKDDILCQSGTHPVTLSADNNFISEVTIDYEVNSFWEEHKSDQLICYIYMDDNTHNNYEIGHIVLDPGKPSGIKDVNVEELSLTEVFNLNGVRVASGENVDLRSLSPGMYIVRQGTAYSKVMLR